jgi:hypothetical protein
LDPLVCVVVGSPCELDIIFGFMEYNKFQEGARFWTSCSLSLPKSVIEAVVRGTRTGPALLELGSDGDIPHRTKETSRN